MVDGRNGRYPTNHRHGFGSALRVRAFLVLYLAEAQSIAGDQLARVALSILVFDRTGSTSATAFTYALTYVPAIAGGLLVSSVRRWLSVRPTMFWCELLRAALFAAMAISGLPLGVVIGLLVVAVFLGPAFSASAVAYLSTTMDVEPFRAGMGLRMMTGQIAQVGGFAIGGVLVATLDPRGALLVNAGTFVLSAALIGFALPRPRAAATTVPDPTAQASAADSAFAGLFGDVRVRWLVLLGALAGFFVVPEALAVPLAHDLHRSSVVVGLLLAALPLGSALGAMVVIRWVPPEMGRDMAGVMAVCCGLPLIATALEPPLPVILVCWCVSGALAAYQVETASLVVQAVPVRLRVATIARASAILLGAQGVGLVVFGSLGGRIGAGASVALAGVLGSLCAAVLVTVRRTMPQS